MIFAAAARSLLAACSRLGSRAMPLPPALGALSGAPRGARPGARTAARTSRRSTGGPSRDSFNLAGELKFMVPEMLFLKALWEFNRRCGGAPSRSTSACTSSSGPLARARARRRAVHLSRPSLLAGRSGDALAAALHGHAASAGLALDARWARWACCTAG